MLHCSIMRGLGVHNNFLFFFISFSLCATLIITSIESEAADDETIIEGKRNQFKFNSSPDNPKVVQLLYSSWTFFSHIGIIRPSELFSAFQSAYEATARASIFLCGTVFHVALTRICHYLLALNGKNCDKIPKIGVVIASILLVLQPCYLHLQFSKMRSCVPSLAYKVRL